MSKNSYGFKVFESVIAIVGIMIVTMPIVMKSRKDRMEREVCMNHLKSIQVAKAEWMGDNLDPNGLTTDQYWLTHRPVEKDFFGFGKYLDVKPICPSGGMYTIEKIGTDPSCSLANTKSHRL